MNLRALFCCVFLIAAPTAGWAQRMSLADGIKAAVVRADEIRIYALLSADLPAIDDILTKDCLYVHSSGRTQTKAQLLADLKSGAMKYLRLQYQQPPLVRLYGSETAIVTGTMELEVKTAASAEPVKRTLVVTCVYVLQNERWQLASYHSVAGGQ